MATAIEFNHVSKQYRLGLVSTRTLSHDLDRWFQTSILRREDPYLKIGEMNDRASKGSSEYVWALRDIDFKVEQGDVVGIIGKNGAGKSTLLKLLSKVTAPTTGTIRARGRIASLLEVGTGFHQEMTGRENIYMNGAILGMTKQEITSKLDEIVAFSGCERYLDTPVKRYSSGMMVRLGFAVAAHLDPEILVVDEVLAVGDAEFQKKAIGKMQDISHGEGRTVLFVSHNMTAVKNLCRTGVIIDRGQVKYIGDVDDAVHQYVGNNIVDFRTYCEPVKKNRLIDTNKNLEILSVRLLNQSPQIAQDENIDVELQVKCNKIDIQRFTIEMMFDDEEDERIGSYISPVQNISMGTDMFTIRISLAHHNLAKGKYKVNFNIGMKSAAFGFIDYDVVYDVLSFEIAFQDKETHSPLTFWRSEWGNIKYSDAMVSIL